MNMSGDEMQNNLDAEFCQILYMIKPYINTINDHYRLEKYRVWLERLSSTTAAEKLERNKYLIELANQIHDDVLKPPFTLNPPRGPLPPLKRLEDKLISRLPKSYEEDDESQLSWPYFTSGRSGKLEQSSSVPNKRYGRSKDRSPQIKKFIKLKTMARPFQTIGKTKDDLTPKNSETSSWYDMSESGTSVTLGFGDLLEAVDQDMKKEGYAKRSLSPSKIEEAKNVHRQKARQELEALKMRVQDLKEVKNALKDTNVLSEDRKKTLDSLQARVTVLEKENGELKTLLDSQQKKYAEMDKLKIKDVNEFKQKLTSSRQKEIENTKKEHEEEIKNLKADHDNKLATVEEEYRLKIESIKDEYEQKIKDLTETNKELMNEKEMEICRLDNKLKNRGDSALNDQSTEQVNTLKRCLSKLDKVLQKTEKDYTIKIEKLRRELEMRDMAAKMQLQTQRADLVVKSSMQKQEEINSAIESLENKYKTMMESVQYQALEARKHDENMISELKSILDEHNITY